MKSFSNPINYPHSVFCTLNLRQDPKLHRNDPPKTSPISFPPPQNIDKIFIPRHIIFLTPPPPPPTIKNIFKILSPQKRFEPKYTCSLYGNIRVNPPPGVHTLPGRKYRVSRSCFATYLATMSYNEPSEHVKSDH